MLRVARLWPQSVCLEAQSVEELSAAIRAALLDWAGVALAVGGFADEAGMFACLASLTLPILGFGDIVLSGHHATDVERIVTTSPALDNWVIHDWWFVVLIIPNRSRSRCDLRRDNFLADDAT